MDLKSFVGSSATIVTIASFFSGALVCLKIVRNGNTGNNSPFPFISGCLCSAVWLRYGLYVGDNSLITVNYVGLMIQATYVVCFYVYCISKTTIHKQLLATCAVTCLIYVYLSIFTKSHESATFASGMIACTGGLIFVASPLVTLAEVIKTKNVESMPFPIIFANFVVSALWLIYGILVQDNFLKVPNGIGAALASLQLLLFIVYPTKKNHHEVS